MAFTGAALQTQALGDLSQASTGGALRSSGVTGMTPAFAASVANSDAMLASAQAASDAQLSHYYATGNPNDLAMTGGAGAVPAASGFPTQTGTGGFGPSDPYLPETGADTGFATPTAGGGSLSNISGQAQDASDQGIGGLDGSTGTTGGATEQSDMAVSGDTSITPDSSANPSAVPVAIATAQTSENKTQSDIAKAANKQAASDTNAAVGVVKAFYNSGHAALGDTLFRIALIVVGIVLLLGALWIIASEEAGKPATLGAVKKLAMSAV